MGIQNLNKFLREREVDCFFKVPLYSFGGYRIAIDTFNWLFTYLGKNHHYLVERQKDILEDISQDDLYEVMLLEWIKFNNKLMNHKITPVWVWDGVSKDNKLVTKIERRKIRKEKINKKNMLRKELMKLNILERDAAMMKEYKKLCLETPYLSPDIIERIKQFGLSSGIPTILAEDEAENLASSLAIEYKVAAVWSRDTDTYPLGAPLVINEGFEYVNKLIYVKGVFTLNILKNLNFTHEEFRDFCIMLGTDFNDNMYKIGSKKSLLLMQKYRNIETIAAETKHNTYCLKQDEVRGQLTPYVTNIEEKLLNLKVKEYDNPFRTNIYDSHLLDMNNNIRDLGDAKNMPRIKKK